MQTKRHWRIRHHRGGGNGPRAAACARAALLAATAGVAPALAQTGGVLPDTLGIRSDTYFLAHDALRGRATGSPGAAIAAEYIAARCLALGLEPVAGRYLHPVPLQLVAGVPTDEALILTARDMSQRFSSPGHVLFDFEAGRTLDPFHGPVAYVSVADLDGPLTRDLSQRVVVIDGLHEERALVAERLRAQGARGLVHLVDSATFAELAADWNGGVHAMLARALPTSRRSLLPALVAGPDVARALAAARERLGGVSGIELRAQPSVRAASFTSHNVACRVAGLEPASGARHIAFAAHYDHLGVRQMPEADSIYNGFSDNAAGVAMVLAIGDVLRRRPLRSPALLLFFTAEELGLLGSDHFVETSPIPLDRVAAVLNLDAGAPPAPLSSWRVATSDAWLAGLAQRVGAARQWTIAVTPARANSDHFPFARRNVPSALLVPGPGPYDGLSAAGSDSLRARWERYHQPGDEWSSAFPWAGLLRYAELALELAVAVDENLAAAGRPGPGRSSDDASGRVPSRP